MSRYSDVDLKEIDKLSTAERMLSILEQQAKNAEIQNQRTAPKENPNYVTNSIFLQGNGEPWASTLKCEMYFGSINYNDSPLTKEEVDALNAIQPIAKATITKNDGSTMLVCVLPKADAVGRMSRLTIAPYVAPGQNPGDARFERNLNLTMPSIVAMANELAKQALVSA